MENCSPTFPSLIWKKSEMLIPLQWEKQLAVSKGCSLANQLSHPLMLRITDRKHRALPGLRAEPCPGACPCSPHSSCTGYPLPKPFPMAPPPPQHPAGALFLIQSLWKQCHNLSGTESDICLMEMLALLWINSKSFSQQGCKTMRWIDYTRRQSSFYYVWKHK